MGKYLDSFNEYGWTKGDISAFDETWNPEKDDYDTKLLGHCLLGHVGRVEGFLHQDQSGVVASDSYLCEMEFVQALGQLIRQQYSERVTDYGTMQRSTYLVATFNDHPDTTEAEVRDLIKKAEEAIGL